MTRLLSVENLSTSFYIDQTVVRSVRNVSFHIDQGEMLAIVGESGCGKSVTALSIMGLIPSPPGKIESGRILFNGENLRDRSETEMQSVRGNDIAMIFQEPMTSLNPIFTVGDQMSEAIIRHQRKTPREARELTLDLLNRVSMPSPQQRIDQYPHELSGGMKQRVMIAMALSCNPKLLIADEPTTALDVTIQAQILDLIDHLRETTGIAILLITHNLGIVAQYAHRVMVMYAGAFAEEGPVESIFESPAHPYTKGLLNSLPRDDCELQPIHGVVPNPAYLPEGCAFHPRCPDAMPRCREAECDALPVPDSAPEHRTACWLYDTSVTSLNR